MQPTALSLTRVIRAPLEKVFAAWTRPELLRQWWGPGPVTCPEAEVDLREGGAYRLANVEADGTSPSGPRPPVISRPWASTRK